MDVHIIKRYSNRKLYDQTLHRWVKLSDIARLVAEGAEIHVLDHATGEDITEKVLADALSRELKSGRSPIKLIKRLLSYAGHGVIEFFKMGSEDYVSEARGEKEEILFLRILRRMMGLRGDLNRKIADEVSKQVSAQQVALEEKLRSMETRIEKLEQELEALRSELQKLTSAARLRD